MPSHFPSFTIPSSFFQYSLSLSCYNSPTPLLSEFLLTLPLRVFSYILFLEFPFTCPFSYISFIPSITMNYLTPSLIMISLSGSISQNSLSCFFFFFSPNSLTPFLSHNSFSPLLSELSHSSSLRIPSQSLFLSILTLIFSEFPLIVLHSEFSLILFLSEFCLTSLKIFYLSFLRVLPHLPSLRISFQSPLRISSHSPLLRIPSFPSFSQYSFSLSFSQNSLSSSFHSSLTFSLTQNSFTPFFFLNSPLLNPSHFPSLRSPSHSLSLTLSLHLTILCPAPFLRISSPSSSQKSLTLSFTWASLVAQRQGICLHLMQKIQVWSLERGNGDPLQYSCLGNRLDRGAWKQKKKCGT